MQVPDYYDIIKQPMDLKTLMHNLKTRQYSHLDQLIADVRLIFDNCHLYNCDESEIYQVILLYLYNLIDLFIVVGNSITSIDGIAI